MLAGENIFFFYYYLLEFIIPMQKLVCATTRSTRPFLSVSGTVKGNKLIPSWHTEGDTEVNQKALCAF